MLSLYRNIRWFMYKFKYYYGVSKIEKRTTFGSVCISNIVFDPADIENILPNIVLSDENLKHMFAESDLNDFNKRTIYRRFMPEHKLYRKVEDYIAAQIKRNPSFYSFLAEGILGLVYRDLYSFQLTKGIINIYDTLNDQHTGVDACMYNIEQNKIVLGEAKFYENLNSGLNKIISDLTESNISNKLSSLSRIARSTEKTAEIIIRNLETSEYDEITVERFLEQDITFAGFVLHSEKNVKDYSKESFYDKYDISVEKLEENIRNSISGLDHLGNFEIILVHLPVSSKQKLIEKMIEEASKRELKL